MVGTLRATIQIFEKISRLHIIYFNEGMKSTFFKHDGQQNMEQLSAALKNLVEFYEQARQKFSLLQSEDPDLTPEEVREVCYLSPNEAEFQSYFMLVCIGSREELFCVRACLSIWVNFGAAI